MAMGPFVRICATTVALLIIASFTLFAIEQLTEGSENQTYAGKGESTRVRSTGPLDQPSPSAPVERMREKAHSSGRELIDDANDVLLAPFSGLVTSRDPWAPRMVSGGLALLLFGLGGALLANVLPRRHQKVSDWREATT